MKITCTEAEALLGAYVLDALLDDEARQMEEHLSWCREHAAAAAELRTTQSLLALTAGEMEPPADLRDRIVRAVAASPPPLLAEPKPGVQAPAAPGPIRRAPRRPRWTPRRAYLAVAAALLVSLSVGGLIGYRVSVSQQPLIYTFSGDVSRAPGAQARLVYFRDRQQALLAVGGLPRLATGQVYEMWLIKGGVPVDEGISVDPTGKVAAQISGDLSRFDQLAITIEPGEQSLPTTTPILIGDLRTGSG